MNRRTVCVGIVSNRPFVRVGLTALVEQWGMRVAATVDPGQPPESHFAFRACDVLVLDVETSAVSEAAAFCADALAWRTDLPVVGVEGFGHAPTRLPHLCGTGLSALVSVHGGVEPVREAIAAALVGDSMVHVRMRGAGRPLVGVSSRVSETDARVLELLSAGLRDHDIAESLCLGESTVKHRIEQLMAQLGLRTRFQLGVWAHDQGLAAAVRP